MAKHLYQVWNGHNKFIFSGRLIFGPDARSLVVTFLLIVAPIIIFCKHVAWNLLHEFPSYTAGYAVLVVAIMFTIYVLVLLLLTSAQDPGIVPRNSRPPEEEVCYDSSASSEAGGRQTPTLRIPRTKEVQFDGLSVRVKYCDTCMLYRPRRCSHCSVCDNCVERFDHHCPWVGQCIGVAMKGSPASVILMAYCFVFLWFVGGLSCFHLYLIGTNQTTYENFRYRGMSGLYDRGCLNNLIEIFCMRIKPSLNNFHAYVQENERRSAMASIREMELNDLDGDQRAKVEDDLDIGGELLKIHQRRDVD